MLEHIKIVDLLFILSFLLLIVGALMIDFIINMFTSIFVIISLVFFAIMIIIELVRLLSLCRR